KAPRCLHLVLLLTTVVSCNTLAEPEPVAGLQIRVLNNSDYDFENLNIVGVPIDNLAKYRYSDYYLIEQYESVTASFDIDGKRFFSSFVSGRHGETSLPKEEGSYTFMFSADFETGALLVTQFEGDDVPGDAQPPNADRILDTHKVLTAVSGAALTNGELVIGAKQDSFITINPTVSKVPGSEVRYLSEALARVTITENLLIKTDDRGTPLWRRSIDTGIRPYDRIHFAGADNGEVLVAGYGYTENNRNVAYVLKTDAAGNRLWIKHYESERFATIHDILTTQDGGFIVSGQQAYSAPAGHAEVNTWLLKIDAEGHEQWQTTLSTKYIGESIIETIDGYVVVGDKYGHSTIPSRGGLIKVDTEGNELWSTSLPNAPLSVIQTSDESFVIAGKNRDETSHLMKIDEAGATQWSREAPDLYHTYSVIRGSDDSIFLSGLADESNVFVKLNYAGEMIWSRKIGSTPIPNLGYIYNSLIPLTDDNAVLIGLTGSNTESNIIVTKFDPAGNILFTTEIE
ncbi:MAG: hypothetical protein AAF564_23415, partial [Bacteroidota bacterium]